MERRVLRIGIFFLVLALVIGIFYTDNGGNNITGMTNDIGEGESVVDSLSGIGNAYVCVTSNGKLYRSNRPCS